mmetsp:Transcript_74328/g.191763  ORF Transcript_74328/g.191763 Transcript_74328/m.191763 type:complete len:263 (-) Transcript_74328:135-923(-)
MGDAPPSERVFVGDLPASVDDLTLQSVFGAYGTLLSHKLLPGQGKNAALLTFSSLDEATWVVENLNGNIPQGLETPINCKFANAPGSKGGWKGGGGGDWKGGGGDWGKGGGKGGDRWSPYGGGKDGGKGGGWGKDGGGKAGIKVLKKGLQYAGVLPGGKWQNDENALFVGGLPRDTTDGDLYEIFATFGAIPSGGVRAMPGEEGTCKGFGFVNFTNHEAAVNAIQTLNGTMMPDGTTLKVCTKGPSGKVKGDKGDKGEGKGK